MNGQTRQLMGNWENIRDVMEAVSAGVERLDRARKHFPARRPCHVTDNWRETAAILRLYCSFVRGYNDNCIPTYDILKISSIFFMFFLIREIKVMGR